MDAKITRCACWMKWFSVICVIPFVIFNLFCVWSVDKGHPWWVGFGYSEGSASVPRYDDWSGILSDLPFWHRIAGFCVDTVSYLLLLWGIVLFVKMLGLFQRKKIFSLEVFSLMRTISRIAFAWAVYAIIKPTILSVVLSFHRGPGNRFVSVTFTSSNISHIFFVGLLLIVVSLVYEGYKLQHEQDLTV